MAFKNLNENMKINELTEQNELLSKVFYDKRWNGETDIGYFKKDDFKYGNGIKVVQLGFVKSKNFDRDADPLQPLRQQPDAITATLTNRIEKITTLTVNKNEFKKFRDAGEEQAYHDLQVATLLKKMKVSEQYAFEYLFGGTVDTDFFTSDEKDILDLVKAEIAKIPEVETATSKSYTELVGLIRKHSNLLTRPLTTNTMDTASGNICVAPLENQVIVMSFDDYEALNTSTSNIYNQNAYKLPEVGKLILANIPSGKVYLFDKDALMVYPIFNEVNTDTFNISLQIQYTLHYWYLIGFILQFGGKVIKLKE